ncbi:Dolichyl-phosphate-mannose--protein mannosyltransferase pmt3 [Balamuthia mandrillaris]
MSQEGESQPQATQDHISLKVVSQDGNEVYFKIKRNTALKKLMDAYCSRQAMSPDSVRFLYDGSRVQPDQTPKELGMEEGDIIDAVLQQTGGC